jgi:hypothetical protein
LAFAIKEIYPMTTPTPPSGETPSTTERIAQELTRLVFFNPAGSESPERFRLCILKLAEEIKRSAIEP